MCMLCSKLINSVLLNFYPLENIQDTLKWDLNTKGIANKGHQSLHLLLEFRSFDVDPNIFKLFYNTFIENVFTICFICGFINIKQRNSKVICDPVRTLSLFCDQRFYTK